MYTRGRLDVVHANGRINYKGSTTRADGADPSVLARVSAGEQARAALELERAEDAHDAGEQVRCRKPPFVWSAFRVDVLVDCILRRLQTAIRVGGGSGRILHSIRVGGQYLRKYPGLGHHARIGAAIVKRFAFALSRVHIHIPGGNSMCSGCY